MGFGRFLKKALIPGYDMFKTMDKIAEHGVVDGIREKIKEDYLEDMPGVSHIYKMGKDSGVDEGKKIGYKKASFEYEKKLLKQAEEFLKQKEEMINSSIDKDKLLDEYEQYILKKEIEIEKLNQEQLNYYKLICEMKKRLL